MSYGCPTRGSAPDKKACLSRHRDCSGVEVGAEVLEFVDGCSQGCVDAGIEHGLVRGVTSGSGPPDAFGGCSDPGLDGGNEFD
jgi:hypothetical protein